MAERENPPELVEPGTPGAIECQAPGCSNWFVKRSGRHRFCKAESCTYRRGAPPEQELTEPEGAAAELLRRLQDPEGGGEVGPDVVAPRLRAVSEAQRRDDRDALYGSLLDAAVALTAWAERVRAGTMPKQAARPRNGAVMERAAGQQPVGLMRAVLSSHARTVTLAERRVEAVWALLGAREALEAAQAGADATVGTEASVGAAENLLQRRTAYERAERALQSVEAAWAERVVAVQELSHAGEAPARNGGATNGAGRRQAA
jgi:hypothetical protein